MIDYSKYSVNVKQLSPFLFKVTIKTPDNLTFINDGIQFHPQNINNQALIDNLVSKQSRNNWVLELDSTVILEKEPIKINDEKLEVKVDCPLPEKNLDKQEKKE